MGKGKAKAVKLLDPGVEPAEAAAVKVPLFTTAWAREHLRVHHGITTDAEQSPVLLTAIHQADHVAAGIGGRPLVVRHYHSADVKHREDE